MKENAQILQRGHIKMLINILYFCVSLQIASGSLENKLGILKNANSNRTCLQAEEKSYDKRKDRAHGWGTRSDITLKIVGRTAQLLSFCSFLLNRSLFKLDGLDCALKE